MFGWCRMFQRWQNWGLVSNDEVAEGLRLARRVIEAGKDDPDALWMAALTLLSLAGERSTAASAVERALALNPNSAHAWMARGWVACFAGEPSSAIEAFEHAMRLSPLDPLGWGFTGGIAFAHLLAGRYEKGMEWADRCLHEQPRFNTAISIKAVCCAHLGRMQEARDCLRRRLELQPELTVTTYKTSAGVSFAPDVLAAFLDGLRRAGLPEQ
jgi:adenylate cyclase